MLPHFRWGNTTWPFFFSQYRARSQIQLGGILVTEPLGESRRLSCGLAKALRFHVSGGSPSRGVRAVDPRSAVSRCGGPPMGKVGRSSGRAMGPALLTAKQLSQYNMAVPISQNEPEKEL